MFLFIREFVRSLLLLPTDVVSVGQKRHVNSLFWMSLIFLCLCVFLSMNLFCFYFGWPNHDEFLDTTAQYYFLLSDVIAFPPINLNRLFVFSPSLVREMDMSWYWPHPLLSVRLYAMTSYDPIRLEKENTEKTTTKKFIKDIFKRKLYP